MASQTTTFYDAENPASTAWASSTAGGIQNRSTDRGNVLTVVDSFTTTSAVTTAQNIALCRLPKNAKVISAELIVPAGVGTTAAKLGTFLINADGSLGAADVDNRYGSGVNLSSAGRLQFITAPADADYLTPGERALVLTPTATSFATAILFTWIVTYTVGSG